MIAGIPYFGDKTYEVYSLIERTLLSSGVTKEVSEPLDSFVYSAIENNNIVIVIPSDNNNYYLTYLTDVNFNYRDRICVLPYFSFDTKEVDMKVRGNNKQHLIVKDGRPQIRYNFKLEESKISLYSRLLCLNTDNMEMFYYVPSCWTEDTDLDNNVLYELYIKSACSENDYDITSHIGGYHYISRRVKGFKNREQDIREEFNLPVYSIDSVRHKDYRDVRNYKYNELIQRVGLLDLSENSKYRRLRFECYLFCKLRAGAFDSTVFKHGIYKIKGGIPLIIKEYWLDGIERKQYTWSR